MADRAFYSDDIQNFLMRSSEVILAKLVSNNPFDLNDLQRDAWISEIEILKRELARMNSGRILLEYTIPRMGKRVDAVVLYMGTVFLLEFKVGDPYFMVIYALQRNTFTNIFANIVLVITMP